MTFKPLVPPEEYLDPKRFPETSQEGLTYQQQRLLDSFNYDELQERLDNNLPLSPLQQRCLKELEQKLGPHPSTRPADER